MNPEFVDKKCGICRIAMNNPSRNRIAENHVKKMLVSCKETGCNMRMPYSKLHEHKEECEYVEVACEYFMLGCNWKGIRKLHNDHSHTLDYDEIFQKAVSLHFEFTEAVKYFKVKEKQAEFQGEWFHKYNDIITRSDINAEFDLKCIWNDFRIKNEDDLHQGLYDTVLRFTGNQHRSCKLTIYFRPSHHQVGDRQRFDIEYKVSVKFETQLQNRYFQSLVLPSIPDHFIPRFMNVIASPVGNQVGWYIKHCTKGGLCEEQWESDDWTGILAITADSIEHANRLINDENDCGMIKVFGYHNVE